LRYGLLAGFAFKSNAKDTWRGGSPNVAFSPAMIMSQETAIVMPPARAAPSIAA
jgi:hypothetical protein